MWLKLLGVIVLGTCAFAFLGAVAFAGDSNSSPGAAMQALMIGVFALVLASAYVLLRRSGSSRGRAALFAVMAMLAVYAVPLIIAVFIIAASNEGP